MEVWSTQLCKICQGTGVGAPKAAVDRWKKMYEDAMRSIPKSGSYPRAKVIYALTRDKIADLMEKYPPCSFCDGKGMTARKEPDATPDEAGSEDFWKK